jgi:alpha-tubulin suppressor-like RCC1 family protein
MGRLTVIASRQRLVVVVAVVFAAAFIGVQRPAPSRASEEQIAPQISAGESNTCAVDPSGRVYCWGNLFLTPEPATPQPVEGLLAPAKRVSTYSNSGCALLTTGQVQCWGDNYLGQLGTGDDRHSVVAVPVIGLTTGATDISTGAGYACAVQAGVVKCWGHNNALQLGASQAVSSAVPLTVPLGSGVATQVSAGYAHTCAVISGAVKCWGDNQARQLAASESITRSAPVAVALPAEARAIAAGNSHTCALLSDGRVFCWGANYFGQGGGDINQVAPHAVTGLPGAVAIAAGRYSTCAITAQGAAYCWGLNTIGQSGLGTQNVIAQPAQVAGLASDVTSISVGGFHACAIHRGVPKCWGGNGFNQLGAGIVGSGRSPLTVQGVTGATGVAAGFDHSCALKDRRLFCWGSNSNGELGVPDIDAVQTAIPIAALTDVSLLDVASRHSCAFDSGLVKCWGENYNGALGPGVPTTVESPSPVVVSGVPTNVVALDVGLHASCVVASNRAYCWGRNYNNRFSTALVPGDLITRPVLLDGLFGSLTSVSIGDTHVCALRADATVVCAGNNSNGQLGDGMIAARNGPVAVLGLSDIVGISAGGNHTCATHRDGRVACWGSNRSGELGDGSYVDKSTPVFVPNVADAREVRVGHNFSCVLTSTAAVKCWGANYWGQLGDGAIDARPTPRTVNSLERAVTAFSVGNSHSCALLTNGAVRCWGMNESGQLGSNTAWQLSPVLVAGVGSRFNVRLPQVSNGALSETEPNNDPSSATPIQSGVVLRGQFNDREDYFVFTKSTADPVRAVLSGGDAADTHLQLFLYQRTGAGLVEVARRLQRDYAITLNNAPPGEYVLRIFANTDRPEVQALQEGYRIAVTY